MFLVHVAESILVEHKMYPVNAIKYIILQEARVSGRRIQNFVRCLFRVEYYVAQFYLPIHHTSIY